MPEDRYGANNILAYPELKPTRHYESQNPPKYQRPTKKIVRRDPHLDNLDDLDNLYKICDLLPPDLAETIRAITDVLSKHTQGLILMRIKHDILHPELPKPPSREYTTEPKDHPEGGHATTPDIPEDIPIPKTVPGEGTPDTPPPTWNYDHKVTPGKPDENEPSKPEHHETDVTPHNEHHEPGSEIWPPAHWEYGKGGRDDKDHDVYITGKDNTETYDVVVTGKDEESSEDAEIDDIFSAEPEFELNIAPTESLVDLARKGFEQDDADIKEHYTTMMTQASQRFFQVMTALAEDANMLDYSDLMQDFDGTAVTTEDANQMHLIDEICMNDVLYDQKLRQMNLTHTPEKTLVMTRAMTAAEAERERYLSEDYKTNMPTISAGLSNDLLQKAREDSDKKYKEASYNMYKFLDSAAKYTQTMLNLKIDSAIAKAELSNTGSDIFAFTPPPQPLPDNVDDNFEATAKQGDAVQKFIDDQKKDSKKGSEVDNGSSASGPGGDSGTHNVTVGPGPGIGKENIPSDAEPWTVDMAMRCSNKCGIPCDWLWGQWANESDHFHQPCGSHNWGGVLGENFDSDDAFADYMAKILPRWVSAEGLPANQAKTFKEYIHCLQTDPTPYCAEPPGEDTYYAACSGALGNAGTVIK